MLPQRLQQHRYRRTGGCGAEKSRKSADHHLKRGGERRNEGIGHTTKNAKFTKKTAARLIFAPFAPFAVESFSKSYGSWIGPNHHHYREQMLKMLRCDPMFHRYACNEPNRRQEAEPSEIRAVTNPRERTIQNEIYSV